MSMLEIEMFALATAIMLLVASNTILLVISLYRVRDLEDRLAEVLAHLRPSEAAAA